MSAANLKDVTALDRLRVALLRTAEHTRTTLERTGRAANEIAAHVEGRVQHWRRELARRDDEVRRLDALLRDCQAGEGNCSGIASALATAQRARSDAARQLAGAERARQRADRAVGELLPAMRRFADVAVHRLPAAAASVASAGAAARGYTEPSSSTSPGSSPPAPASAPAVDTPYPSVGATGTRQVPLDAIDLSDSSVEGPHSYKKVPYGTMQTGLHRLADVVLPAVEQGAGSDHFRELDRERGLAYEHGYQRIYDAFFGDDSVRLDRRADGTFGVTNGYHRIHLAKELGWTTIPARIAGTGA